MMKEQQEFETLFFKDDGGPKQEGDHVHNYLLAATLRRIAQNGAFAFYDPKVFPFFPSLKLMSGVTYSCTVPILGHIAPKIVEEVGNEDRGILTLDDMYNYYVNHSMVRPVDALCSFIVYLLLPCNQPSHLHNKKRRGLR